MTLFMDAPIFDADQHMYETPEALTRYLPDKYRSAVKFIQDGHHTRLVINGRIIDTIPNPTFERVAAPGAYEPYFSGQPNNLTLRQLSGHGIESISSFREPGARIESLDSQGVTEAFVYPTLANLVEHSAADDPELVVAIIHALNRWMLDDWGFVHENRLFMTPVICCAEVDDARRELEFVLSRGAKVVLMRPSPAKGLRGWRSPAMPEFDAYWGDIQEASIPVVFHSNIAPLSDYISMWEPARTLFNSGPFGVVTLGHREIEDMLASMICHGALTRFPNLRISSVENGASWIRPLMDRLRDAYNKMTYAFDEDPIEVFRRNIWVSPFWEGSVADVVEQVGWDKVMFGSDFPHPEGLEEPKGYYRYAEGMDEKRARDFMGDNARRLLGIPILAPRAVP